jgi:hypothetical protein
MRRRHDIGVAFLEQALDLYVVGGKEDPEAGLARENNVQLVENRQEARSVIGIPHVNTDAWEMEMLPLELIDAVADLGAKRDLVTEDGAEDCVSRSSRQALERAVEVTSE